MFWFHHNLLNLLHANFVAFPVFLIQPAELAIGYIRKRKLPSEIKKLNNNYYLYHSTTRWDKEEKKVKKVSDYIGRITPKGVVERKKSNDVRSIYEYGSSEYLHRLSQDIIKPLKKSRAKPKTYRQLSR